MTPTCPGIRSAHLSSIAHPPHKLCRTCESISLPWKRGSDFFVCCKCLNLVRYDGRKQTNGNGADRRRGAVEHRRDYYNRQEYQRQYYRQRKSRKINATE